MDPILKHEVALYLFPFYANTRYKNKNYYNILLKKYGKKVLAEAIAEECKNGKITDAFSNFLKQANID